MGRADAAGAEAARDTAREERSLCTSTSTMQPPETSPIDSITGPGGPESEPSDTDAFSPTTSAFSPTPTTTRP